MSASFLSFLLATKDFQITRQGYIEIRGQHTSYYNTAKHETKKRKEKADTMWTIIKLKSKDPKTLGIRSIKASYISVQNHPQSNNQKGSECITSFTHRFLRISE